MTQEQKIEAIRRVHPDFQLTSGKCPPNSVFANGERPEGDTIAGAHAFTNGQFYETVLTGPADGVAGMHEQIVDKWYEWHGAPNAPHAALAST